MITVNFTGGARKSFDTNEIMLNKNNFTVKQLIDYLITVKPKNTANFDGKNLLIAINDIDSSALNGYDTILKNNDVVNIIPIIHGGSLLRMQLQILSKNVEIFEMKKTYYFDNNSLNILRNEFSDLIIQAVSTKFLLNKSHIKKIILLSLSAKKQKNMISKKLETDILLRFAGTTQINQAIENVGLKPKNNFTLIAIGNKSSLEKLFKKLIKNMDNFSLRKDNSAFLKKYFQINKKHLDSIHSNSALEDILAEKACIL